MSVFTSCNSGDTTPADKEELTDSIVALRQKGKQMRNESRFDEALQAHNEGLRLARIAKDTSEVVQALNNIGTDYRRMGILDVAQEYHYEAWRICEESTDTTFDMRKNRVVSLNGLGNIYLTIKNYERADSAFRLALEGEKNLGSATGQAINYANLGAIYKAKGDDDKALEYYKKSMELNRESDNSLGIALCHTYYGSIFEKHNKYDNARAEYDTAYQIMKASKDRWHSLETLLALASIDIDTKNYANALKLLREAENTATEIESKEHLAEIHKLYYTLYNAMGDYKDALSHHVAATSLQDSVMDMDKSNRIHNTGITIERNRQEQKIKLANEQLIAERSARFMWTAIFCTIGILLIVATGTLYYTQRIRNHSYKVLKEASSMRENFFTNITHEFRTPLTVILGLSKDIAKNDNISEDVAKKVNTIHKHGHRLLTLITQLLDISRIKGCGIGEPDWRNGDIVKYIKMVVESYSQYASTKDINIQINADRDITLDFVPDYVNKVIGNLLSNSLKFTQSGGQITIDINSDEKDLNITFADNGCGIDEKHLSHIFTPFYTDNNGTDNNGTGIGLALVKQIIMAVDGSISVKSKKGEGTTFSITLPIHNDHKNKTGNTFEVTPENVEDIMQEDDSAELKDDICNDNSLQILVVEDNHDVAEYIGSQLKGKYNVTYAQNGKAGLEKAIEIVPDVIITDVMMPEMNGIELCKAIRSNNITDHIPIIVVTAKITEEDKLTIYNAGADAYLSKPFNSDELVMRINKLIEQRQMLRDKYSQIITNAVIPETEKDRETAFEETIETNEPTNIFISKIMEETMLMLDTYKEVNVASLADKMKMSTRQLHRKLTSLTGKTPVAFIQTLKVKKAQDILDKNPEMPFKSVAIDSGFTDYSNFARVFKAVTGITPSAYINSKNTPQ